MHHSESVVARLRRLASRTLTRAGTLALLGWLTCKPAFADLPSVEAPEPAIHEHSGGALFTLSPQGEPGVLPATHQHLVRLRAMLRQRLTGPVKMTCHPHRVGLSSSVAIYLEGKLKQAVNILITVTGQTSWPQEEEYAHPRWYITVPDSADLVYLMLWINGLDV